MEERSNYENFQYNIHINEVSEIHGKDDNLLKLPSSTLPNSHCQISEHFNKTCNSYNNIFTLNDCEMSPNVDLQMSWDINKTQEVALCNDISNEDCRDVETNVETSSVKECHQNTNCLLNNICNQSQHYVSQQKLSENRIGGAFSDGDNFVADIAKNKNDDNNLENMLANLKDHSNINKTESILKELNISFNESDYQDKSCIVPIKELTSQYDFHQYSNIQDDQMKEEENGILDSQIISSYKEKLSNLQYPANIMKNLSQSVVAEKKVPTTNYPNPCTAFRSQVSTFEPAKKNCKEKAKTIISQNINISRPVDLLSNFIQVQLPFQKLNKELDEGSLKAPSMSPFNQQLQSNSFGKYYVSSFMFLNHTVNFFKFNNHYLFFY